MRLRAYAVGAALLATALTGGATLSAQSEDERVERRQAVGGWRVEYVAESDGGLVIRMRREGEGYRLRYHEVFWRGNYGPSRSVTSQWRDCGGGGEESGENADQSLEASELRRRFAGQLAECGAGEAEIAAALETLEPAFAVAAAWTAEAAAATAAEAAAIAAYGNDMAVVNTGEAVNVTAPEGAKRR
jgi:hypothetical protein